MKVKNEFLRSMCEFFLLDSGVLVFLNSGDNKEELRIIELLISNVKVSLNLLSIGGFSEKEVSSECGIIMDQFSDEEWEKKIYDHYEKIVDKFNNNIYV